MTQGQLRTAEEVRRFALAGNATLTLVSKKTQTRYTYRVRKPKADAPHFVSVMFGPDNEGDYAFMCTIFQNGQEVRHGRRSNIVEDDPRARGFRWFWSKVQAGELPTCVEVWHEGRCCRCNRKLTVPTSIASGIGPECAGRVS